jgi:hypothetical protein
MTRNRLSLRQAQACENALNSRCRCRCGGALHGAKRGGADVPGRAWFEDLPANDPHRVSDANDRRRQRKEYRERWLGIAALRRRERRLTRALAKLRRWASSPVLEARLEARITATQARIAQLIAKAEPVTPADYDELPDSELQVRGQH